MILDRDRQLIATWAEHGMPDNDSTREHAVKLLNQMLAEIGGLHSIITALVEQRAAATVTLPEPVLDEHTATDFATATDRAHDLMAALETSVNEAKAERGPRLVPRRDPHLCWRIHPGTHEACLLYDGHDLETS